MENPNKKFWVIHPDDYGDALCEIEASKKTDKILDGVTILVCNLLSPNEIYQAETHSQAWDFIANLHIARAFGLDWREILDRGMKIDLNYLWAARRGH